jgi:hypothetical protein
MERVDSLCKTLKAYVIICLLLISWVVSASNDGTSELHKLENPISVQYLKTHLRKDHPRLVLTSSLKGELLRKIKQDDVVKNVYQAIRENAYAILDKPFLERKMTGKRMLSVSREMLYRMNMLGMVYSMEKDSTILNRINDEVLTVCGFSDWNPKHYLDVAEMALAVSFAIDWTGVDLPEGTRKKAIEALIEKGIQPSFSERGNFWWVHGNNNWNQVCHGGLVAAAITIAEDNWELAAKTIHRALEGMPHALKEYGPDGVYPEGSTYWGYGTSYTVVTAAMFESALDTDFGLSQFPGLMESAMFRLMCNTPTGRFFNFADCGEFRSKSGDFILAWFAAKTGNTALYEKERWLIPPGEMGKLPRLAGASLVWISQFEANKSSQIPSVWSGGGENPIVIFTGGEPNDRGYYLGAKGGRGNLNHGNMDAGSFVFELDGVRWAIDPGNQDYHSLEKEGFNLWGSCQECERWTLLTKNNFGHNTLSVDNQLHVVNGQAFIVEVKDDDVFPEATIDLSATFEGQLVSAKRRFLKDGPTSLIIKDQFQVTDSTQFITWQMLTQADVEIVLDGAVLSQDGKHLKLEILSPEKASVSVVSLYPAPLKLDKQMEGLKRIEIRLPAWMLEDKKGEIKVRLAGV